jgi:hypothetical protein
MPFYFTRMVSHLHISLDFPISSCQDENNTQSHQQGGDDASGSTGTLANKATKKTSKAPLKPISTTYKNATAGGKAAAGKKATGGKKAADENQTAYGNDKPEKDSPSGLSPLPSPTNSVGDLIPHRNSDKMSLLSCHKACRTRLLILCPLASQILVGCAIAIVSLQCF